MLGQHNDKWDFGLSLSLSYQVTKDVLMSSLTSETTDLSSNSVGIGLIGRRWLLKDKKVQVFLQPRVDFSVGSMDVTSDIETDFLTIQTTIPLGITYQLTEKFRIVGLLSMLRFNTICTASDGSDRQWEEQLRVGTANGAASISFEYNIR